MNLRRTAEYIVSRNWDKVPLPNGDWEGRNDQDNKVLDITWTSKTVCRVFRSPLQM